MTTKAGVRVSAAGTSPVCVFGPVPNSSVKPGFTQKTPPASHLNLKVALWLLRFETWGGGSVERSGPREVNAQAWWQSRVGMEGLFCFLG